MNYFVQVRKIDYWEIQCFTRKKIIAERMAQNSAAT